MAVPDKEDRSFFKRYGIYCIFMLSCQFCIIDAMHFIVDACPLFM
jgi:hypothetical protein